MKKVLLVNWDSYPNVMSGGVYSWEKVLVESMSEYEFLIINLLSNPNVNGRFAVPEHVERVIDIPLFGSHRYEEFYREESRPLLDKIRRTRECVIHNEFIPLFRQFLEEILSNACDPQRLAEKI
ncbi:MAG TPA: DUF3492 domain-containing protein, partial [Nitrososphaera sp.]|nr:DUF3492 domain-containing protein [Nitrososphaera sp.]